MASNIHLAVVLITCVAPHAGAYRRDTTDFAVVGARSLSSTNSNTSHARFTNSAESDAGEGRALCLKDGLWFVKFQYNTQLDSPDFYAYYEVKGTSVRITDAEDDRVISEASTISKSHEKGSSDLVSTKSKWRDDNEPKESSWVNRDVCVIDYKLREKETQFEVGQVVQVAREYWWNGKKIKGWRSDRITAVDPLKTGKHQTLANKTFREKARWEGSQKDYVTLSFSYKDRNPGNADRVPIRAGSHWIKDQQGKDQQIKIDFMTYTSFPKGSQVKVSDIRKTNEDNRYLASWQQEIIKADPVGKVMKHLYHIPELMVQFPSPNNPGMVVTWRMMPEDCVLA